MSKLYYSIREVSELFDEEQHVLRHWEREFPILHPHKNRAGNRVYTERDFRVLRVLKVLLREERKSVAEVRSILADGLPVQYESIANDPTIEQRFEQRHRVSLLKKKLMENNDIVVLSRQDAEFILATLKRLGHLLNSDTT